MFHGSKYFNAAKNYLFLHFSCLYLYYFEFDTIVEQLVF